MDNSLHKGMDALLNGQAQKDMSAYKGTYDEREHRPQQSAFEQFQDEYPALDQYGQKVASGGFLKENLTKFDTAMSNARGEMFEGVEPTTDDNLLDYFGAAGITKKLTPSESKYFDMIIGSPADKAELYEMVPSFRVKKGVASVSQADSGKLADYIDETYNLNEGMRLPPSFYKGDFAKRFGFDEASIPDFNASKTPTFDDLMSQEIPAMLQRQSGLQVDPSFKPKPSMLDDDIFTLDNRYRNR